MNNAESCRRLRLGESGNRSYLQWLATDEFAPPPDLGWDA
jgi:hypothetical protein